jgi:hypothetical protein
VPVGLTGQDSSARHTWAPPLDGRPSVDIRFTRWVSKSSCSRVSVNSLGAGERDQWVSTNCSIHQLFQWVSTNRVEQPGVHEPRPLSPPSPVGSHQRGVGVYERASATRPAVGVLEPRISGCPRLAPVGVQDWS